MNSIQADIEAKLAEREPDVEVLVAEVHGDTVELYIDHPDGVTLELCERVTHALPELLEEYGLTVSSPGPERPLSKPAHVRGVRSVPSESRSPSGVSWFDEPASAPATSTTAPSRSPASSSERPRRR